MVRPWLAAAPGRLTRRYVVVPTRGQSHALKQRCLAEGVALLGVEFLSPGLARQKWLALARPAQPALGRELLLLGLRAILARRLARLADVTPPPPEPGLLKSLQSDAERALDHFDELLQAGFTHEHFGLPLLRDLFGELSAWVRETGYDLAQLQSERGALTPVPPEAPRAGDALLIYGLSAEAWGEFFNVAALARRCGDLTVVLPEPALRGRGLDEQWVQLWEDFLGVEAVSLAEEEAAPSCDPVGQALTGEAPPSAPLPCEMLVGRTHADEMALVAGRIGSLLAAGAGNIAVIFPGPETGHRRLAALLAARGLAFADLLETPGTPPIEVRVQRALLRFYERGGRLEEFLELWTLLRTLDWVKAPPGAARAVCEQLFDECQSHLLAACANRLAAGEHPDWRAVHKLAERLLPAWPAELTLADALARFDRVCAGFLLPRPVGWDALAAFAERETRLLPLPLVTGTLAAFLPETSPAMAAGKGAFARVTFTTRRRATGVAWSHVIFTGANAGVWPVRRESGPWLPDEHRRCAQRGLTVFAGPVHGRRPCPVGARRLCRHHPRYARRRDFFGRAVRRGGAGAEVDAQRLGGADAFLAKRSGSGVVAGTGLGGFGREHTAGARLRPAAPGRNWSGGGHHGWRAAIRRDPSTNISTARTRRCGRRTSRRGSSSAVCVIRRSFGTGRCWGCARSTGGRLRAPPARRSACSRTGCWRGRCAGRRRRVTSTACRRRRSAAPGWTRRWPPGAAAGPATATGIRFTPS